MVKVSIEIRSETACFAAAVQAKSIQRTLSILVARYRGSVATLKFPNDPEVFFLAFPPVWAAEAKAPSRTEMDRWRPTKPRKMGETIMRTATLERTDAALKGADCLRVRSTENETWEGTDSSRETL